MGGWLVNDCLTCIPGTETFWHDLLDWIPQLQDMCGGYTPYDTLADAVEKQAQVCLPDFIIRNGSYFRPLKIQCPTISLIQDILEGDLYQQQIDVCNSSTHVVFNSEYVSERYLSRIEVPFSIIPLGVDFDFFVPSQEKEVNNTILFVGSSQEIKGFQSILEIIKNTSYNFYLIMKDDFKINHPRVKVFNKLSSEEVKEKMQECSFLICTSIEETQHLAGIEAAACGLPILATNVGVYYNLSNGPWGRKIGNNIYEDIEYMFNHLQKFSSRKFFYKYSKENCSSRWKELIREIKI